MIRRILGGNRGGEVTSGANVFIGGVASTISTASALATRLNTISYPVSVNDIEYFAIVGNNIEASVNKDYQIKTSAFRDGSTYFRDLSGRALNTDEFVWYANPSVKWVELASTVIGNQNFQNATGLVRALFPNATTIEYACFYGASGVNRIYILIATTLGTGASNINDVFSGIKIGCKIYAHPSLATSNNGGEDKNIADARNLGSAVIRYVQNFIKPSAITNLTHSAGTLNFTPPASTNALDFYEVYKNGFYHSEITVSGAAVSGLVAGDKVEVYACDIYYNRSKSNEITI